MSESIHHGTERFEGQSKQALESILSRSVMPHTIDTFYTSAMQALCALADRATAEYTRAHPDTTLTGSALEDVALGYKFGDLLTEIGKREELVKSIQVHVFEKIESNTTIYVPPQQGIRLTPGSGRGLEFRSVIPRVTGLLYSVHNDLGIDYNDAELVRVERGIVRDDMMRNEPYYSVEIPDLKRLVLVCEEEGNATYVFDTVQLRKLGISIAHVKLQNKLYFRSLNESHPDAVVSIRYSENWRERMLQVLSEPFETRIKEKIDKRSKKAKSDFIPRIEFPKKKDGWETKSSISNKQKLARWETIASYAEVYRESHPEWFEMQLSKAGSVAEHYHPELVAKIREHFLPGFNMRQVTPPKRDGWENASALEKLKGFPRKETIKKFVIQFRTAHPEWFEIQNHRTKSAEHYHPELIAKIQEHFSLRLEFLESLPPKRDEWVGVTHLVKLLGNKDLAIKDFANTFRTEHPEWFEMQLSKAGSAAEHYHPELVARLQEHFIPLRKLREDTPLKRYGWESCSSLRSEGYADFKSIKKFVIQFRTAHPEWFEAQNVSGNVVEHYHPELVVKIREHFFPAFSVRQITPLKRDGWENASALEKLQGFPSQNTIKKFVTQFRAAHPEWFEMQNIGSRNAEHYHPELLAKIREYFSAQQEFLLSIPAKRDGWESPSHFHNIFKCKVSKIIDFANTFRTEHPQWFEMQVSKSGSAFEYYHPELAEKIRSHFSKKSI